MQKEKKDKHFIKKPTYEGGLKAMKAHIKEHLRYPKKAYDAKIEGSVTLRYTINYKGKVIDAKVISGLSKECDLEAIRLVKTLIFTAPKNRGVKAKFHKNITIHFRLPKVVAVKKNEPIPKPTPIPASPYSGVQYNVVSTKKEKKATTQKQTSSYNFTINIG